MATKKRKKKSNTRKKKKKSNSIWLWIILLFGGVSIYLYFHFKEQRKPQTASEFYKSLPKGYAGVGIDVSHHQGEIDWDLLLKEKGFDTILDFVYCKVTEGTDHVDTQWERNREYLNKHGIPNGAYHYFKPMGDSKAQAEHFLFNYKIRSIDLPPVLDVEEEGISDEELRKKVVVWCNIVKKETGINPIIYTSLHFYETKFREQLTGYNYWIAAYSREPKYMMDKSVLHWQFSENGRLPGIDGKVDLNVSKINL